MKNSNDASKLSPTELATIAEWKRRKKIQSSLVAWCQLCGFEPAKHHRYLIERLEDVVRGKIRRLAIFMPPGTAKSTYASVLFPPWFLAQRAGLQILACSHSVDKAEEFSRKARNLIALHSASIGYDLSPTSKAAGRWETTNKGEYQCAGVSTGIAGFRAHLALIDDPIGKKEDADSKLIRDKQWNWYEWDFMKRLQPDAPIILIQTRWHEDDLAGRLLAAQTDAWTVVNLPLIAEEGDALGRRPGEALWPEYFNAAIIADRRRSPGFAAQEQQRPAPEEGDYFKRDWIRAYEEPGAFPTCVRMFAASDHACTKNQQNDRSSLGIFGVDEQGDIWIHTDTVLARLDPGELVDEMMRLARKHRPIAWWAENDMISKSIGPFLNERMHQSGCFIPIEPLTSVKDLISRAQSIRGRMRARSVWFPSFAPWYHEALHEMLSFPVGTHDDFVAMLAEIGRGLDRISYAVPRKIVPEFKVGDNVPITMRYIKEADKRKTRFMQLQVQDW